MCAASPPELFIGVSVGELSCLYEKLLNYIEKFVYVVIQIEFSSVNFTNISTNFYSCNHVYVSLCMPKLTNVLLLITTFTKKR